MDYTEGIFDDFNDALTAQLAWDPSASTDSVGREYCNYFFGLISPKPSWKLSADARLLAPSATSNANYDWRFVAGVPEAAKLESLTESVAAKLPAKTRQCWRWRVCERRARIELLVAKLHGPTRLPGENCPAARRRNSEASAAPKAGGEASRSRCLQKRSSGFSPFYDLRGTLESHRFNGSFWPIYD